MDGVSVQPKCLVSSVLSGAGFRHAFPLRDVAEEELVGSFEVGQIAQVHQVHGARAVVVRVGSEADVRREQADALVTHAPGIAVGVRTADCLPVLVADPASGGAAALHAGWRGVVAGVVRAGIDALGARDRSKLIAAVGPCIGPCCFEVGADVAAEIAKAAGTPDVIARRAGDKAYVDLRSAVRSKLRALGLLEASIEDVPGCTKHEHDRFHSYRRDGANSGRQLSIIVAQ
jgi:YfiH family protein